MWPGYYYPSRVAGLGVLSFKACSLLSRSAPSFILFRAEAKQESPLAEAVPGLLYPELPISILMNAPS
jgi:hypothetical protein